MHDKLVSSVDLKMLNQADDRRPTGLQANTYNTNQSVLM